MPRKAQSKTKKAQLVSELQAELYARAVTRYQAEQNRVLGYGETRKGLRVVRDEVEKEHFERTKQKVSLDHVTLWRLVNGGVSIQAFHAEQAHLTPAETEEVIKILLELASWGHPFSYQRLKEYVNQILRARLGNKFPADGVGINWARRFCEKHSDRLHLYRSKALDNLRGRALNEAVVDQWFKLVEEVQLRGDGGFPIAPECTWAMDESGFQPNGNEGIDLAFSKKGWTDDELGVEYIKNFDLQTAEIARGRQRALYVDGHRSHLTYPLLTYARDHKITIPCYPPHTTHGLQGLDVVCFSPVKNDFGKRRDDLLRETGDCISKQNFLKIYGETHLGVLTPSLIKDAFRKTGVIPVDQSVITAEKMAPSRDSSSKVISPVLPATPVRILSDALIDLVQAPSGSGCTSAAVHEPHSSHLFPVRTALHQLRNTNAAFLINDSPIKGSAQLPDLPTFEISPVKSKRKQDGAEHHSRRELQELLDEKQAEVDFWKGTAIQLQSQMVLQRVYCARLRRQLQAKELKASRKGLGVLKGDGLGRIATTDEMIEAARIESEALQEKARAKERRARWKVQYEQELEQWQKDEEERKKMNENRTIQWKRAVADWEEAKGVAKKNGARIGEWAKSNPKPKKSDEAYCPLKAGPRPKMKVVNQAEDEEDWSDTDNDGDDDGNDDD
ncbi:hypothetical protein MD484_g405, partial [Candolleomyces efflorescens]